MLGYRRSIWVWECSKNLKRVIHTPYLQGVTLIHSPSLSSWPWIPLSPSSESLFCLGQDLLVLCDCVMVEVGVR